MEVDVPAELPSDGEWRSLREWAETRPAPTHVSTEWSTRFANSRNLTCRRCRLVGPLLAARLCVEAHGRARLARLPSGTVRFSVRRRPSSITSKPGPFAQARPHFHASWINRSPRWVRGKIARMLAGKIASPPRSTPSKARLRAKMRWPRWNNVDDLREANKHPPSRR